ncbi:MAG: hypothetical protein KDI19_11185, partial [Pseudomonadales bacterium]|nr:hypothetical protein [Pseudomonadales bacterium]
FGYLHYVEGLRPDVELRDRDNLVFSNRLASPFVPGAEQKQVLIDFARKASREGRPVYFMSPLLYPYVDYGAFVRYDPGAKASTFGFLPQFEPLVHLLVRVYRQDLAFDNHEQHFVFNALIRFSRLYVGYGVQHPADVTPAISRVRSDLMQTFPGKLVALSEMLELGTASRDALSALADDAGREIPPYATRDAIAALYEIRGRIELRSPADEPTAARYFRQSVAAWPSPDNPARCRLRALSDATLTCGEK